MRIDWQRAVWYHNLASGIQYIKVEKGMMVNIIY